MKKRVAVVITLILAFSTMFAACSGGGLGSSGDDANPEPAPTPAPASDASEDLTYEEPEISLVLTNHDPDTSLPGQYCFALAEKVKELSNGRLEIQVNNNGTLAGPTESLEMLRAGTVDIAMGLQYFYADVFPLTEAYTLPTIDIGTSFERSQNLMDVFLNTDLLTEEYSDFQVIMLSVSENQPFLINEKITSVHDLQGKKLRIGFNPVIAWANEFGIQCEGVPINETYSVLQNGSFDGTVMGWQGIEAWKLQDVVDYIVDVPMFTSTFFLMMNKDKYTSLPDWAKEVIDECSGMNAINENVAAWDETIPKVMEVCEAAGVEIYSLDEAAIKEMQDVALVTNQGWIDNLEAKGLPAQRMYDTMMETAGKYQS